MDAAPENSIISISSGIYVENIVITKGGLTMMPTNENDDVILVIMQKPTITINIPAGQTFTIHNIKISHSGKDENA